MAKRKIDHQSRSHALLSASGAELWLNCPGSAIAAGTLSAHRLHARTCLGVSLSCKNDPSAFPRQQNRRVECFAAQKRAGTPIRSAWSEIRCTTA